MDNMNRGTARQIGIGLVVGVMGSMVWAAQAYAFSAQVRQIGNFRAPRVLIRVRGAASKADVKWQDVVIGRTNSRGRLTRQSKQVPLNCRGELSDGVDTMQVKCPWINFLSSPTRRLARSA